MHNTLVDTFCCQSAESVKLSNLNNNNKKKNVVYSSSTTKDSKNHTLISIGNCCLYNITRKSSPWQRDTLIASSHHVKAKYSLKQMFLIISKNDCPKIIKVKCPLIANSVLVLYRQQFLMKIRFCLSVKDNYSIFHNLITLVV